MGAYTLGQAKENLDRLVDEALSGELVTITREGQAVVSLTPAPTLVASKPTVDPEFLDWMRERRKSRPSLAGDSVTLVREMREEE